MRAVAGQEFEYIAEQATGGADALSGSALGFCAGRPHDIVSLMH
jgi:hypothetical protein